ncbi:MAG: T9SS type A sorting domain-containing protein, partial [Flavisolibacter sp.]|nr:T9SS type A sorting domain-containing protein [Flavisolibacter sp.]
NHYKAVTLLLSRFGLASTVGFPEMIDHVVLSDEMAPLYINFSATLFNDIENLTGIANYAATTSDHYPVLTRYVLAGVQSPLPVRLVQFDAVKQGDSIKLVWRTAQEINAKEFVVEHAQDGMHFKAIGKIDAVGNSSSVLQYQYMDAQPAAGHNFYRLRIRDRDEREELSRVIRIDFSKAFLYTIKPNPATTSLQVITSSGTPILLQIVDFNGRMAKQQLLTEQTTLVPITDLSKGMYFLRLVDGNKIITEKLIVR